MVKLKFKHRALKQNIFNLNRGRPLRFVSSGHTTPSFGSFLSIPKPNFNRSLLRRPAASFYGDSDGDGVMNGFDCAPFNKRKQGPEHDSIEKQIKRERRMAKISDRKAIRNRAAEEGKQLMRDIEFKGYKPALRKEKWDPKLTMFVADKENELSPKDEYKYSQGALVMKSNKESEDALAKRSDPSGSWTKELKAKEKIFPESHPVVKAHREEEKKRQKEDHEQSYEDEHELTAIPNPEGYDYDSQDED